MVIPVGGKMLLCYTGKLVLFFDVFKIFSSILNFYLFETFISLCMYKVEFTRNALKSLKKIDTIYQRLVIEKLEALQGKPV